MFYVWDKIDVWTSFRFDLDGISITFLIQIELGLRA